MANTAESIPNPKRTVPRATYLALAIAGGLHVLISIGVYGTLTVDEVIASGDTALAEAAKFHSIEPAWNDRNLNDLARHLVSPLVFAHIRASTGSAIQQANCSPFRFGRWLWMHNGVINDFARVKRDLAFAVDPSLYPQIEGSTDSELFFYLARSGERRLPTVPNDDGRMWCGATLASHHAPGSPTVVAAVNRESRARLVSCSSMASARRRSASVCVLPRTLRRLPSESRHVAN